MNKYRNIKTIVNGIKFDSKAEAERYIVLRTAQNNGEITDLKLQPQFELQPKYINNKGKTVRAITYKADFSYIIPSSRGRQLKNGCRRCKRHGNKRIQVKKEIAWIQISRHWL